MMYAMDAARAWALFRLERHDEAANWALKAAQKPNAHVNVHALAALILACAGRMQESFREAGMASNAAGLQHRGISVVVSAS